MSIVAWLKQMVSKTIDRVDNMTTQIIEIKGAVKDLQKSVDRIETTVTSDKEIIYQITKDVQRTDSDIEWIKKNLQDKQNDR